MTRVLLLIPTLDRSGAEKQLTLLATGLSRDFPDEFEVDVACLTRGGPYQAELEAAGVSVTVLGKRFRFDPFALRRLKKLIQEKRPDILHTWLFAANSYGRLVAGKQGSPGPKVIVSERCVDTWKASWQLWLDRKQIPRTERLIGNSQAVVDFYRKLGVPDEKLLVFRNGIELPTDLSDESLLKLREEFGIAESSKIIGFVGRLAPQKRLKDLLWSFELVCSHDLDVHFVITGDGPQRSELERFAKQIRVHDRVTFTGHRDDAASIVAMCDLFWLASDFEGQSNSLMEAMASARPVIVSDIAPNRELVSHEETGLVVPVTDRAEFAKAAVRLLGDEPLAARLGVAAQEQMANEFSVRQMIESHAELYRTVAGAETKNK
ncbi:MAG: glycosyltransferase [Planctomycetes bacterium]|nr:glycosyltransferase [Planctomycetota bacterium]